MLWLIKKWLFYCFNKSFNKSFQTLVKLTVGNKRNLNLLAECHRRHPQEKEETSKAPPPHRRREPPLSFLPPYRKRAKPLLGRAARTSHGGFVKRPPWAKTVTGGAATAAGTSAERLTLWVTAALFFFGAKKLLFRLQRSAEATKVKPVRSSVCFSCCLISHVSLTSHHCCTERLFFSKNTSVFADKMYSPYRIYFKVRFLIFRYFRETFFSQNCCLFSYFAVSLH